MRDTEETVKVAYIGLKKAIHLKLEWMSVQGIMMKRGQPVDMVRIDAEKLIAAYPGVFGKHQESELERFEREECGDLEELTSGDTSPPKSKEAKSIPKEDLQVSSPTGLTVEEQSAIDGFNPAQAEFGIEKDDLLCPFCAKTYKINNGRGKAALVAHLVSEHPKAWATAIISQGTQD